MILSLDCLAFSLLPRLRWARGKELSQDGIQPAVGMGRLGKGELYGQGGSGAWVGEGVPAASLGKSGSTERVWHSYPPAGTKRATSSAGEAEPALVGEALARKYAGLRLCAGLGTDGDHRLGSAIAWIGS